MWWRDDDKHPHNIHGEKFIFAKNCTSKVTYYNSINATRSFGVICPYLFSGRIFSQVSWIREGVRSQLMAEDL